MPDNERSPLSELQDQIGGMTADLRADGVGPLGIGPTRTPPQRPPDSEPGDRAGRGDRHGLTALPLLVRWLARAMDGWLGVHQFGWCNILAVGLFLGGDAYWGSGLAGVPPRFCRLRGDDGGVPRGPRLAAGVV